MFKIPLRLIIMPEGRKYLVLFDPELSLNANYRLLQELWKEEEILKSVFVEALSKGIIDGDLPLKQLSIDHPLTFYIFPIHDKI